MAKTQHELKTKIKLLNAEVARLTKRLDSPSEDVTKLREDNRRLTIENKRLRKVSA